jgi:hypothetical protein
MKPNLLLVLALVTLMAGSSLRAQEPQREFTPRNGFEGRSEGNGSLRLFFGRPRPFHVESYGFDRPDGTTQLDQTITVQGKRPRDRTWVITDVGSHQYTSTLSDAAGPLTLHTDGSRLVLRYRAKGPFVVHQTLVLSPDGRTIDNFGRITLLGIPVGRLQETIIRKD